MKFGHTELFCRDVAKNAEFYTKTLGFKLVAKQSEDIIWVGLGDFEILLKRGNPSVSNDVYEGGTSGIVIYTDDLEKTKSELVERGLKFDGTDSGNPKCLTFRDYEGHWFQLVNPHDH